MIPFPHINPIALELGPLKIHWYALSYVVSFLLGWKYCVYLLKLNPKPFFTKKDLDDFLTWAIVGVVVGGRLGFVLFYKPLIYLQDPLSIFYTWEGGMSFHGGLGGMIAATILFCRKRDIPFPSLTDLLSCAAPIGLFFGRIGNFINGEVFGRMTDVSWAMQFPGGGPFLRHPSQLYEAFLEGIVLFILLYVFAIRKSTFSRVGYLSGMFLVGYAIVRILAETFREPDAFLGFIFGPLTMGQLLSLPMALVGLFLMFRGPRVTPSSNS